MNRYARQQILQQVGEAGQRKLQKAHALVVGAGALGCPVLQYLVGAGIGRLTLVDHDVVDRSNLHRQPLYGETSLGQHKAIAAQVVLQNLNPDVEIVARVERLDPANAAVLAGSADVVLDCADSFAVTYILSDVCLALRKPFIMAAVLGLSGYAGGFCGSAPSVRAVFPELPTTSANCATAGVLGPVAGLLGCLQAQMALAVVLELQPSVLGQMAMMDLETYRFRSFRFDAAQEPSVVHSSFIARSELARGDFIVDLRGTDEAPVAVHPDAVRATVDTFRNHALVPKNGQRAVLCCRSGQRAWHAATALRSYWDGPIGLLAIGDAQTPSSH